MAGLSRLQRRVKPGLDSPSGLFDRVTINSKVKISKNPTKGE